MKKYANWIAPPLICLIILTGLLATGGCGGKQETARDEEATPRRKARISSP